MSKSLGNSLLVTQVVKRVRPIELRWYLASAHYRSNLEFSDSALSESAVAFGRIENFVTRASEILGEIDLRDLPVDFIDAMNEDLNVPAALAVLHDVVGAGNSLLAETEHGPKLITALSQVRGMLDVLGVDPLNPTWNSSQSDSPQAALALDALVQGQIVARAEAKEQKDFAKADAIRDQLSALGITLQDSAESVRWILEK
jgi:cysteinyl-tRNA synthetase